MKSMIKEMYDVLSKLIEIRRRIVGCKDPNCRACAENKAAYQAAIDACARYDIDMAKKRNAKKI